MKAFLFFILLLDLQPAFSQSTDVEITETTTTIDKSELSPEWKSFTKDTSSPTYVEIDLNGDRKSDFCGFFKGVEHALMIFGDLDGDIEELYHLEFDESWYKDGKFAAVMCVKKKGQEIMDLDSGKHIKLAYDSIYVRKFDGQEFVLVYVNKAFQAIRIKG